MLLSCLKRIFTFKDVNTLCVWGVFVWVIGRSEEPSFWFLHPRSTLTCGLHSRIVFHWNTHSEKRREKWEIKALKGRMWRCAAAVVTEITCCILPCCPRQPKYEKTCNNCKNRETNTFLMEGCDMHALFFLFAAQLDFSLGRVESTRIGDFGFVLYTSVMLMLTCADCNLKESPKSTQHPK